MSTETIDIVVTESGAASTANAVAKVGTSAEKSGHQIEGMNEATKFLKETLATLGLTYTTEKLIESADAYTGIINRLKLTSSSAKELIDTEQKLFDAAQATRQSFEGTAELYSKLALQANHIGIEQSALIPVITTLNQAISVSGVSAQQAKLGLIQLSQGLSAGTLQGQDLKAVLEDIPFVGQQIAAGLGIGTAALRKMGAEGKLTSKEVLEALIKQAPEIAKAFAVSTPTIAQAFQEIQNSMLRFIGQTTQANGSAAILAQALLFLAKNFNEVVLAVGLATSAFALYKGALLIHSVVTSLIPIIAALNVVIAANPLVIIAAAGAITALVIAFKSLGPELSQKAIDATKLGTSFLGMGKDIATGGANADGAYKEIVKNQKDLDKAQDEAFKAEQERIKKEDEERKKSFDKYMKEIQDSIDAQKKLDNETRNAFGDIIEITDQWAFRSGAAFNQVKDAQDGFKSSLKDTADVAVEQNGRITSSAQAATSALKDLSYASVTAPDEGEFRRFAGTQGYNPDKLLRDINTASTLYGTPSGGAALQNVAGDLQGVPPQVLDYLKANFGYLFSRIESGGYGKFKDGGSFAVGGSGGTDSSYVSFMATPGETVTVSKGGQGGGVTVHMTVVTKDADSFKRSQTQVLTSLQGGLNSIAGRF